MNGEIARKINCILCNKGFDSISTHKRKKVTANNFEIMSRIMKTATIGDPICSACIQRAKRFNEKAITTSNIDWNSYKLV